MKDWKIELTKIAEKVINGAKNQIIDNGSSTSGRLVNSFDFVVNDNMILISYLEYGNFLDSGTKPRKGGSGPGFYDSIWEWAQIKGKPGYWPGTLESWSWAVYKNILKKGTKPHPWIFKMEEIALNLDSDVVVFISTLTRDKIERKFEKIWLSK